MFMPTFSIDDKSLFYQDVGRGYPILFGHSYFWSSEMWRPQLDVLSKEFRCIAVDLWDHGKSGHLPASAYTIEKMAQDYIKLMDYLKIAEFAIVGLSVGGMWGVHVAFASS